MRNFLASARETPLHSPQKTDATNADPYAKKPGGPNKAHGTEKRPHGSQSERIST